MKYKVLTLNDIAPEGLEKLPSERYAVSDTCSDPDAILLRSHDLHTWDFLHLPKVIVRAGAGVNNIPMDKLTALGVPVLNTPGANANAVKELVFAGLLIGCRHLMPAWDYTKKLNMQGTALKQSVEQGKKQFSGSELSGKVLGVIGLGAIGVQVANLALAFGMRVIGYDPVISVRQAWQVEAGVKQAQVLEELLSQADFVTLHVPANEKTHHMIDADRIKMMKSGCTLLNFARGSIVDNKALLLALNDKKIYNYVSDFPEEEILAHESVVCLPHLGASTSEAEENCAVMAAEQLRAYLETGEIRFSVNFPEVTFPWRAGNRVVIVNKNIPNMVGQVSTVLAEAGLNVLDMLNKSRDSIAITLVDLDKAIPQALLAKIAAIDGIISVRHTV